MGIRAPSGTRLRLHDIAANLENKVIIFTGSGETFIHREDLGGGGVTAEVWATHVLPDAKRLLMNLLEIQAPMIAAVNGPATVHAELALLCDVVLAARITRLFRTRPITRAASCPVMACTWCGPCCWA